VLVVWQDADNTTRIDGKKDKKNVFKAQQMLFLFPHRPTSARREIDFSAEHRQKSKPRESDCFSGGNAAMVKKGMKQFNLNSSPSLRQIFDQKLTAHASLDIH
jgi:hypothetical protein